MFKMNRIFNALVLVLVGAGAVTANLTCPDGKLTCTEGQTCCFQSGTGYSCCDRTDETTGLIPGIRSTVAPFSNLSLSAQPLFAPSPSPYDFCPFTTGKKICCNPPNNCLAGSECCNANTCCVRGLRCCGGGQWCCLKKQKCGPYFNTCKNGAGMQGAQGLAVVVAVALTAIKFARI